MWLLFLCGLLWLLAPDATSYNCLLGLMTIACSCLRLFNRVVIGLLVELLMTGIRYSIRFCREVMHMMLLRTVTLSGEVSEAGDYRVIGLTHVGLVVVFLRTG